MRTLKSAASPRDPLPKIERMPYVVSEIPLLCPFRGEARHEEGLNAHARTGNWLSAAVGAMTNHPNGSS